MISTKFHARQLVAIRGTSVLLTLLLLLYQEVLCFTNKNFLKKYHNSFQASSTTASVVTEKEKLPLDEERYEQSSSSDIAKFVAQSLSKLASGSDIRGTFLEQKQPYTCIDTASDALLSSSTASPLLTPFAAYCFGKAFAHKLLLELTEETDFTTTNTVDCIVCVGRDPRTHGTIVSECVCRGINSVPGVVAKDTGLASTPSMFVFCRENLCHGGIMITASHLPCDKNGLKFFTKARGGYTKSDVQDLIEIAKLDVMKKTQQYHGKGGKSSPTEKVNFMPLYAKTLRDAIIREVHNTSSTATATIDQLLQQPKPLSGIRIVLNAGGGSGAFFDGVLRGLGADTSSSIGVVPNSEFPLGVPNPENPDMVSRTIDACAESNADLGIMLDTDADRSGFVLPRSITVTVNDDSKAAKKACSGYEVLNRNRLIALLGVAFAQKSPGCTIVTDSGTSEGLAHFLTQNLRLRHCRYLKGYANVIGKAKRLCAGTLRHSGLGTTGTINAEMAIETSGHCAMKENDFVDDGTYTAVKLIGMLAKHQEQQHQPGSSSNSIASFSYTSLLELIVDLNEMETECELRMKIKNESLETTNTVSEHMVNIIKTLLIAKHKKEKQSLGWKLDEDNLEGIRIRTTNIHGGFFMLRKSLHDPVISLQVEGASSDSVIGTVIHPLLGLFRDDAFICDNVDFSALESFC